VCRRENHRALSVPRNARSHRNGAVHQAIIVEYSFSTKAITAESSHDRSERPPHTRVSITVSEPGDCSAIGHRVAIGEIRDSDDDDRPRPRKRLRR
jgi:hypothetical protein